MMWRPATDPNRIHETDRMPRNVFIVSFPTHYRRRLYQEVAKRMDTDFYFCASERERYWIRRLPLVNEGPYRRIERRRFRIAGQSLMPGVAASIAAGRYDAVVKSLNG